MKTISKLEGTQKDVNSALSKYSKLLEKSFNPDISKAYRNIDFDIHTVNRIIADHFYQEGQFILGDCFVDEPEAAAKKSPFLEMYQILEAIRSQNLEPALQWATTNHEKLKQNGSDIELKLHRLQFVEILKKCGRDEALKYARAFLAPFAASHIAEVQKLMACLLWAGRLDSSPYAELLSPMNWDKLAEELTQQFCHLIGQSYESPLSVTVAAGVQGLPTLLKLMNGKKQEWHVA
ncbi:RMD5 homolog A-like [Olea europaea subsp. europaea]|uniref:RMD5 homolog A-like n=1 Tax=Olea europaea subsp. europaea TaxID=158383 RepID=A0A8S0PYT0_OLEEU|nr:RMD5 homolog A-like [Olea europaea subsp. europaea]